MFVKCDAFEAAISTIPKVGSQSIEQAVVTMRGGSVITNEEAILLPKRVFFIRNPITRVTSSFSFFWWLRYNKQEISEFIPLDLFEAELGTEVADYKKFIDYILLNSDNHWSSQVDQMRTTEGVFVPTVTHQFEDVHTYWKNYAAGKIPQNQTTGLNMPWLNAWTPVETDLAYRSDELLAVYGEDLTLWNNS